VERHRIEHEAQPALPVIDIRAYRTLPATTPAIAEIIQACHAVKGSLIAGACPDGDFSHAGSRHIPHPGGVCVGVRDGMRLYVFIQLRIDPIGGHTRATTIPLLTSHPACAPGGMKMHWLRQGKDVLRIDCTGCNPVYSHEPDGLPLPQ